MPTAAPRGRSPTAEESGAYIREALGLRGPPRRLWLHAWGPLRHTIVVRIAVGNTDHLDPGVPYARSSGDTNARPMQLVVDILRSGLSIACDFDSVGIPSAFTRRNVYLK